jgi:PKD repeat protein
MLRSILGSLVAVLCLCSVACDSGNPVAPGSPIVEPPAGLTVTVAANPTSIDAGSPTPAMITVSAKKANGTNADNGTEVTLTTTLGSFTQSAEPQRTIKQLLNNGNAMIPLYAGNETGTASLLAQVGSSVGRESVSIVVPPEPVPPTVAEFSFVASGLAVTFTDASTGGPTSWKWDFGDGTGSTERNPVHQYSFGNTYTVKLDVDGPGGKSSRSKFVSLTTGPPVAASFDYEKDPNNPLAVQFFDRSTGDPTAWSWNFGDGKTSNARNPTHTYAVGNTYTVTLTATNAYSSGNVSRFINTAPAAPTSDFDWDANGRIVQFVSKATSGASLEWNFGDGTMSTELNPAHSYAKAGTYAVTLTATNAGGSATSNKIVETDPIPDADFIFTVDGSVVTFMDRSTNTPTSWKWRFGDGTLGYEQNPVHQYGAITRTYVVTLEATNSSGTGTITKEVKIVDTGLTSLP